MTGRFTHSFSNLQSLEEFFLSLKVGLECIHEYRLAKPPWAAQVIILIALVGKVPNKVGLVNI